MRRELCITISANSTYYDSSDKRAQEGQDLGQTVRLGTWMIMIAARIEAGPGASFIRRPIYGRELQ